LYALYDYDGEVAIDHDEVSEYKWIGMDDLKKWIEASPEDFTRGCLMTINEYLRAKEA
jgi:isopentenyldiphosphate isomerase